MLGIPADEQAVLWIDDRNLSRYLHAADHHPIIGITDVLAALRQTKVIDDGRYFTLLHDLRGARAHFIPITAEEVVHHLRGAPVNEAGLVETPGLAALRRSVADALLMEEYWALPSQAPPGEDIRNYGEARVPFGLLHLFEKILVAVWRMADIDPAKRHAWAAWASKALRVRHFERIPVVNNDDPGYIERISIASAFGSVFSLLDWSEPYRQALCQDLVEWMDAHLLEGAIAKDPDAAKKIADAIASLCLRNLPSDDAKILCRRFIGVLPKRIRQILYDDAELTTALGIQVGMTITVDGRHFDTDKFWTSIHEARQGRTGRLTSTDGETTAEVTLVQDGELRCYDFAGDLSVRWADDPAFALLDDEEVVRRAILADYPEWTDRPPVARTRIIDQIATAPTRTERMRLLTESRSHSVSWRLAQWREYLSDGAEVELNPSPAQDMVDYLRLDISPGRGMTDALAGAASALVSELGPAEAVRRLAGLPIVPPAAVIEGFEALSPDTRFAHLDQLAAELAAPMARLHVLALMRRFGHPRFSASIDRLLDEWPRIANAFLTVLRWTERAGGTIADWCALPGPLRLALVWSHAHLATDVLLNAGVQPDDIFEALGADRMPRRFDQMLVLTPDYGDDASFPDTSLNATALLYHGLAAVVGDQGRALLTEAQRRRLDSILYISVGDQLVPHPGLLRHRRDAGDGLGSFLVMRPEGIFETQSDVGWTELDGLRSSALDALLKNAEAPENWSLVLPLGLHQPDTEPLAPVLAAIGDRATDQILSSTDTNATLFLLRTAAEVAAVRNDPALIDSFLAGLIAAARTCAGRHPFTIDGPGTDKSPTAPGQTAMVILETLSGLSKRHSLNDAVSFLADGLLRLADAWPHGAPFWRRAIGIVYDQLPPAATPPLWRTWLRLRALP